MKKGKHLWPQPDEKTIYLGQWIQLPASLHHHTMPTQPLANTRSRPLVAGAGACGLVQAARCIFVYKKPGQVPAPLGTRWWIPFEQDKDGKES